MTITNEDLLNEVSQEQLIELSDLEGAAALNQAVIDDATNDALSLIKSFILIPANPTPLLKKIAVELTIYELRKKNELVSDNNKERYKEIEAYLSKMAKGSMPTTIAEQDAGTKREKSFAFKTSKRKLEKRPWDNTKMTQKNTGTYKMVAIYLKKVGTHESQR